MRIRQRHREMCDTCEQPIFFDVLDNDGNPVALSYVQVTHLTRDGVEVTERSDAFARPLMVEHMGRYMNELLKLVMIKTGCLEYARPLF